MAKKPAVAYYRTSSATNVGWDKDSEKRQRDAVMAYAKSAGFNVVREYYDAAVSGADPVEGRPGFSEMLEYMLGNGARTILVEAPERFARDLAVQIAGHQMLQQEGIDLIPTTAPVFFTEETPTAQMVRNILGAVSQFERQTLVSRLKRARDRKSAELGYRIEGPKHLAEHRPNVIGLAQALSRMRKSGHYSNPDIARLFEKLGIKNSKGKPFSVVQIRRIVLGPKVPAATPRDYLKRLTESEDINTDIDDRRFQRWALPGKFSWKMSRFC